MIKVRSRSKFKELVVLTLQTSSIVDPANTSQARPGEATQEGFNTDGSDALFSMYINKVIEEDRRMVESWKGDADGMLTFVSVQTTSHNSAYNLEIVGWSLLCCGRGFTLIILPDYSAQLAGHIIVLSRTTLSTFINPAEWIPTSHPVNLVGPSQAIRPTYIGCLGQWALVLKSRP